MQVLNNKNQIIPNLYAAGEATGGIFGRSRIPCHSLIDALVGGRASGAAARKQGQCHHPGKGEGKDLFHSVHSCSSLCSRRLLTCGMIIDDHGDAVALFPSCYKPGGALDSG